MEENTEDVKIMDFGVEQNPFVKVRQYGCTDQGIPIPTQ
jgi:hypothetical protein